MKADLVLSRIRGLAPENFAADWDNSRVQIAGTRQDIRKLAVALDPDPAQLKACLDWGADLVLTHHPLFFKPVDTAVPGRQLDILRLFLACGAWLYAAHTSLDCRPDGPAFWLGRALGLENRTGLEAHKDFPVREVFFQAPSRFTEREARPLAESPGVHAMSQSASGEVRVVIDERFWPEMMARLKGVFSDADIEYYVRRLESPSESAAYGQAGDLPKPLDPEAFFRLLESVLFKHQKPCPGGPKGIGWAECGPRPDKISRVAFCTGSGGSLIPAAFSAGADVFVCGDVKHHAAMEAPGLVLDVGHFILEEEMMRLFAQELSDALGREAEVRFFAGTSPFRFRVLA